MAAAYLYLNAALYAVFAVWCTVTPVNTARNIGYTSLSSGGRSEYLVIYGGLQLGLAVVFWLLARNPTTLRLGLQISIAVLLVWLLAKSREYSSIVLHSTPELLV